MHMEHEEYLFPFQLECSYLYLFLLQIINLKHVNYACERTIPVTHCHSHVHCIETRIGLNGRISTTFWKRKQIKT